MGFLIFAILICIIITYFSSTDGYFSEWVDSEKCSKTCGGGRKKQTRTYIPAKLFGKDLVNKDMLEQYIDCNTENCPIDGYFTEWKNEEECNVKCGGGKQKQTRKYIPAKYGGKELSDNDILEKYIDCNMQLCPIDGSFSEWIDSEDCNKSCGGGKKKQTRKYIPAKNGGKELVGELEQIVNCNTNPCPIDGTFSNWINNGKCSTTCGGGKQKQTRIYTAAKYGGKDLDNKDILEQYLNCNTQQCPVDGYYTDWVNIDNCTKSCGGGKQKQIRTYVPAKYGGKDIDSPVLEQYLDCNSQPCPVDGIFSNWVNVGTCSTSCGDGNIQQTRTYTPAKYGGKELTGPLQQTITCNIKPCPVDGFMTWTNNGQCSLTCGGGKQKQIGVYTPAKYGGKELSNKDILEKYIDCNTHQCPVDGFMTWTNSGQCSIPCGGGKQKQIGVYTPAKYGGKELSTRNILEQYIDCNNQLCPVDGVCSDWIYDQCICETDSNGNLVFRSKKSKTYYPARNGGKDIQCDTTSSYVPCDKSNPLFTNTGTVNALCPTNENIDTNWTLDVNTCTPIKGKPRYGISKKTYQMPIKNSSTVMTNTAIQKLQTMKYGESLACSDIVKYEIGTNLNLTDTTNCSLKKITADNIFPEKYSISISNTKCDDVPIRTNTEINTIARDEISGNNCNLDTLASTDIGWFTPDPTIYTKLNYIESETDLRNKIKELTFGSNPSKFISDRWNKCYKDTKVIYKNDILYKNDKIYQGIYYYPKDNDIVILSSGIYQLRFRKEGNLVLYRDYSIIWETSTSGKYIYFGVEPQTNIIIYDSNFTSTWSMNLGNQTSYHYTIKLSEYGELYVCRTDINYIYQIIYVDVYNDLFKNKVYNKFPDNYVKESLSYGGDAYFTYGSEIKDANLLSKYGTCGKNKYDSGYITNGFISKNIDVKTLKFTDNGVSDVIGSDGYASISDCDNANIFNGKFYNLCGYLYFQQRWSKKWAYYPVYKKKELYYFIKDLQDYITNVRYPKKGTSSECYLYSSYV